jgi:ribonuclease HI
MLYLYTDGASRGNPGNSAIAFLAVSEHQSILKEHAEVIGETTNNAAEYSAIIKALEYALDSGEKEVTATSDSELVISQLQGKYKVKARHLFKFYDHIKDLETSFKKVVYRHAPRENKYISLCDKMVNEILDRGE